MNNWNHLLFFDKNGKYYNFDYDSLTDRWSGNIYLPQVSVGLFEVGQIFILEELINRNTGSLTYGYPHSLSPNQSTDGLVDWMIQWKDSSPTEIVLFQYNKEFNTQTQSSLIREPDGPPIEIYSSIGAILDYDPNQIKTTDGFLSTDVITSEALEINFSLISDEENTYKRTLQIINSSNDHIIGEFTIIGETIGEDERLKVMTANFGYQILSQDSTIFKNTDINESLPDYIEINTKRKEIMLEGHNIYPFIGSYKGLINCIKFFGYTDLEIREFWKNVNSSSPNFGKYIQTNPIKFLDSSADLNDRKITLPNKNYRKTSLFSLIYKINNIQENSFDEFDIPLVSESNDYSIEEILIKLFGLKKKLENEFLPLNAKIRDIVGEADFFGLNTLTSTISRNVKNNILTGIAADFCVTPNECTYLQDLRSLDGFIKRNMVMGPINTGEIFSTFMTGSPDENSPVGPIISGETFTVSQLSNTFLSFFTGFAPNLDSVSSLPDKPGIPIGSPVVLTNCSESDLDWNNVDSTWNQLDLYSQSSDLYTWDTINYRNFIDIEWSIYKEKTNVSPEWFFNIKGGIKEYNSLPVILPYIGSYTVEMRLFDLYNNISSVIKSDVICVDPLEVEFSGWYQSRKLDYTWNSEGSYNWKDYGSYWDLPIEPSVKWEDETPSLYDSLDRVNAILNTFGTGVSPDFQLLNFQDNGKVSFSGPYFWENLGEGNSWDDSYHLWWDMTNITGDTPAFFEFKEIVPNSYLKIVDLSGNVGLHYFSPSIITLRDAVNDLRNSSDRIIRKYEYNLVLDASSLEKYIQASCRYFGLHGDFLEIEIVDSNDNIIYSQQSTGENSIIYKKGLSVSNNPTWNTAKFIDQGTKLPRMSWVMFVYDKCKIKGKDKPRWLIRNNSKENPKNIYFDSKYLTYLFKEPGNYTIGLEIIDSNSNKYIKESNILIIK